MSQNHPHDNIYNILSKLEALKPTPQETHDAIVKSIYESVEARGSITSGVSSVEKRLTERFAAESDFSKMSNAIQKTGKSKASADAITAAAGREKLGQKEMTRRAVAGKKKAAHEGNVVSGALADKSIPVGDKIPGTNLKKNKQIEVEEAFNPNSVDAQQARDSKAHHHAELKKKADAGDADAQKRLDMIKKRRDADVKNFNDKMDYMEECAMCAEGTCTEHGMAEGNLKEFAPNGGGNGGDDYLRTLASAWYNQDLSAIAHEVKKDKNPKKKGIMDRVIDAQVAVEKMLARGVVCGDSKVRKFSIDYNSDFDGVVMTYEDYAEYSDYGDDGEDIDSRTGKPWPNSKYDQIEFTDDQLDEGMMENRSSWAEKGKVTPDAAARKKASIKSSLGKHHKANLPEQGVAEGDGDEAYVACIVQFNRSGRAMVQRTKPISHERAEEVIRNALAKNTFVHPPFMTIYPASAGKLDGSTIMAQFPDMSQKGLAEADNKKEWQKQNAKPKQLGKTEKYFSTRHTTKDTGAADKEKGVAEGQLEEANIQPTGAMSRSHIGNLSNPVTNSVVHPSSGKEIGLITQQPTGEYYAHPSSTGLAHSQGATFATKDEAHQFIRNAHAKAIKNGTLSDKWQKKQPLPQFAKGQQGVAEGFPTVADAKADHEKKEKEKGTGKFEKKTNPESGGTEYTRKSSTYDNGGKKSVKESMSAVQSRFLMEANLKRMAEEHGQTLDEMMAKMSEDMKHYRDTGECSAFLRDCMDMHGHNKKLEMEEAMNRPELPDPWMGVKDAPHPAKPSFASRVAGTAKSFGQKALSTLGHPSDEEMLKDLERKAMDEELDQLAELAGLKVTKRAMPEATVKVDTPDEEPVNAPKERYATMKQAPNVLGVGDGDIAGGDHPNHGGPGDNPLAPDLRKPRSVHPVKTLEAYINAEYESIKKAK